MREPLELAILRIERLLLGGIRMVPQPRELRAQQAYTGSKPTDSSTLIPGNIGIEITVYSSRSVLRSSRTRLDRD